VRRRDDFGAAPRPPEVAREDGVEGRTGEGPGLRGALPLAELGQRHVEVTDEPPRGGVLHLAVAQEIDGGC
jgi:hypothetical protein